MFLEAVEYITFPIRKHWYDQQSLLLFLLEIKVLNSCCLVAQSHPTLL